MNLPQCNVSGGRGMVAGFLLGAQFMQKHTAVLLDGRSRVVFGEAEIEVTLSISVRTPSETGGESVEQPWDFV